MSRIGLNILDQPAAAGPVDGGFAVLHVLDAECSQSAVDVVDTLRSRLGKSQYPQHVVALGDGQHRLWLDRRGIPCEKMSDRGRLEPLRLLNLGKRLAAGLLGRGDEPIGLIHAHSPSAGMLVGWATIPRPRLGRIPLAVEVHREGFNRELASLASLSGKQGRIVNVLCRSQELRRQAVGLGFSLEQVGVLRPPVDMGRINAANREAIHRELDIEPGVGPVLLAGGWCQPRDNQQIAMWGSAICNMLHPDLRIIIPGVGRARHTLEGWIKHAGYEHMVRFCENHFDWPQLVAASDILLHAASAEAETADIGWAMSAGRPIVAAAITGTAELLEDHHNALLAQPENPRHLAMQLQRLLTNEPLRRKLADQARHEAFHYFKPSDIVALYKKFYQHYRMEELGVGDG